MTKKTKKYIDYITFSATINLFVIFLIMSGFVFIIKSEKYPSGTFLIYYFSFGVMLSSVISTYILLKKNISPNFIAFTIYKKAVTYIYSVVAITTILYTLLEGDEIIQYFTEYESSKTTLTGLTLLLTSINLSNILLDFLHTLKTYYKKKKKTKSKQ